MQRAHASHLVERMSHGSADLSCLTLVRRLIMDRMEPAQQLFEDAHAYLKAGAGASTAREVEEQSCASETSTIAGGGIALRLLNGHAKTVPPKIKADDVEVVRYLAVGGLAGEFSDCLWWAREDSPDLPALKRSWGRVDKGALSEPLFAPRFPGTAGAKADWDALKADAVALHCSGKVPGLIAVGARDKWLEQPMVYPILGKIKAANWDDLKGVCPGLLDPMICNDLKGVCPGLLDPLAKWRARKSCARRDRVGTCQARLVHPTCSLPRACCVRLRVCARLRTTAE